MTVSAVAPSIFLKGITPLRTITHKNLNLAGPTKGIGAGYFCHGDVRGGTARSNSRELAPHFPGCDAPQDWVFPYLQSRGPVRQFGFGSVTAMGNIEMIWCETIDCGARNMIKSDEHRFATNCAGCHAAFALKGKDFS